MEVVELTDEELLAVQDDYSKLEEAVKRNRASSCTNAATQTSERNKESRNSFDDLEYSSPN
jgi:hypothetical protein